VHERLTLYKRLANCDSLDEVGAMQEELIDRFGALPPQAQSLLESHRLRLLCKPLGVVKLDAAPTRITLQFEPNPPIEPIVIIGLIQKNRNYRLAGQDKLSLVRNCPTLDERVAAVRETIKLLSASRSGETPGVGLEHFRAKS
jgi:transcription-repair coupling factor (superfamily II helicase)